MITIKTTRLTSQSFRQLKTSILQMNQSIRKAAYIVGNNIDKDLKRQLTKKGRSGRIYKIYKGIGGKTLKKPRRHRASTKQEYPAVITGEYRKSTGFEVKGVSRLIVGSGKNNLAKSYAEKLEDRNKPIQRINKKNLQKSKAIFHNTIYQSLRKK